MWRLLLDLLHITFNPTFWLMNYKYDEEWDMELVRLMNQYRAVDESLYIHKLGDKRIWTTNYPYAYASPFEDKKEDIRPSRLTILRLRRKIRHDKRYEGISDGTAFLRRKAIEAAPMFEWVRRHLPKEKE